MDEEGFNVKQITFINNSSLPYYHKYFNGEVFYWSGGYIYSTPVASYAPRQIVKCYGYDDFDISRQGLIVFTLNIPAVTDKRYGTFWTADADGSDTTQLTFNHY